MRDIDFVIEVYRVYDFMEGITLYYRFIPVGTTVSTFHRPPDFVWGGKLKPGNSLGLDHPCVTWLVDYIIN